MTQPNILELARQGDVQAIASLINRQLQPKDITAKVALREGCLQVILESTQVPDQQMMLLIRKGITGLGTTSIERVKVYGRQIGEEFPAWSKEFEIVAQVNPSSPNVEMKATSPLSISSFDGEKSKIKQLPIQSTNPPSQKTLDGEKWNVAFIFLLLASIVLLFIYLQLAIITGIAAIVTYRVYQATPAGRAAAAKRQREAEQKAEEERLKKLQQEEARKILVDNAKSEVKNLQTNLAQTVIHEFTKVNARLSVGVSYMDLPGVIASAKLATQQFEKSKDYNVCPYLSELIKKNMLYYELSFECFQRRFKNSMLNNDLEQIITNQFPELQWKTVYGNFEIIVQRIWREASNCSDEIQEILEFTEKPD